MITGKLSVRKKNGVKHYRAYQESQRIRAQSEGKIDGFYRKWTPDGNFFVEELMEDCQVRLGRRWDRKGQLVVEAIYYFEQCASEVKEWDSESKSNKTTYFICFDEVSEAKFKRLVRKQTKG